MKDAVKVRWYSKSTINLDAFYSHISWKLPAHFTKKKLELFHLYFFTVYNSIVPKGFLPWEIRVAFPGEKPTATESRYPTYCAYWVF